MSRTGKFHGDNNKQFNVILLYIARTNVIIKIQLKLIRDRKIL